MLCYTNILNNINDGLSVSNKFLVMTFLNIYYIVHQPSYEIPDHCCNAWSCTHPRSNPIGIGYRH